MLCIWALRIKPTFLRVGEEKETPPMIDSLSVAAAVVVFIGCTAAMLGLTLMWATANRHPVKVHAHMTGRPAEPYWHSPTGLQDERGIRVV
jgi:hypothetical protein